jgi:hypothetical protein
MLRPSMRGPTQPTCDDTTGDGKGVGVARDKDGRPWAILQVGKKVWT